MSSFWPVSILLMVHSSIQQYGIVVTCWRSGTPWPLPVECWSWHIPSLPVVVTRSIKSTTSVTIFPQKRSVSCIYAADIQRRCTMWNFVVCSMTSIQSHHSICVAGKFHTLKFVMSVNSHLQFVMSVNSYLQLQFVMSVNSYPSVCEVSKFTPSVCDVSKFTPPVCDVSKFTPFSLWCQCIDQTTDHLIIDKELP